jgi:hypothetical protein
MSGFCSVAIFPARSLPVPCRPCEINNTVISIGYIRASASAPATRQVFPGSFEPAPEHGSQALPFGESGIVTIKSQLSCGRKDRMLSLLRARFLRAEMLRPVYMTILFLWLSGCGSIPGLGSNNADRPPAGAQRDNSCATVAEQRAQDAAYNDYDRDMQRRIYDYTYAECVTAKKKSSR